jgi:hypothetical protein
VHGNARRASTLCSTGKGNGVPIVRVDAARTKQHDEMEGATFCRCDGAMKLRKCVKITARDRCVNTWQILRHALSRTNVQVTNFAVSHLPCREPYRLPARRETGVRPRS